MFDEPVPPCPWVAVRLPLEGWVLLIHPDCPVDELLELLAWLPPDEGAGDCWEVARG